MENKVDVKPVAKKVMKRNTAERIDSVRKVIHEDIMPLVQDIIQSFERGPSDPTQKNQQSAEISQKTLDIQKGFANAREKILRLPGINCEKRDQLNELNAMRKQLRKKYKLVKRYQNPIIKTRRNVNKSTPNKDVDGKSSIKET